MLCFFFAGGTKGIGRSIVRAFLKEGATVHFCSRTASDVQAANETYRKDYPDSKVRHHSLPFFPFLPLTRADQHPPRPRPSAP